MHHFDFQILRRRLVFQSADLDLPEGVPGKTRLVNFLSTTLQNIGIGLMIISAKLLDVPQPDRIAAFSVQFYSYPTGNHLFGIKQVVSRLIFTQENRLNRANDPVVRSELGL